MLTKFAVTNYRGFKDRIQWDLSKPNNYEFNTEIIKDGIIKNGILYGQNGSGKSNFALSIFDIVNHLSLKWKMPDYYNNFVYAGNPDGEVKFEYTFKLDNDYVEYIYSKNQNGIIISEKLSFNKRLVFDKELNSIHISEEFFHINNNLKEELLASANNISLITFIRSKISLNEDHFLMRLQRFVDTMLWFKCLDERAFIGLDFGVIDIEEYIIKNDLVQDYQLFINRISNQYFKFAQPQKDDKYLYCLVDNNKVQFLQIASTGTQSLELFYYWFKQLNKSSFVFIDEFDAFYHYRLSFNICKELLKLNCQVFLSSHNTYLMTNDLLRPDCNFIIDNNKIKPLCDCTEKELRFGHNIEKLFRGNTFKV